MANNNRFTGEHSKVLINLKHVIYARGEDHAGSDIKICMRGGRTIDLSGRDADMFRAQWREKVEEHGK